MKNFSLTKCLCLAFVMLLATGCKQTENDAIVVMPKPVKMVAGSGSLSLSDGCVLAADVTNDRIQEIMKLTAAMVKERTGLDIAVQPDAQTSMPKQSIFFSLGEIEEPGDEAYELTVDKNGVKIKARNEAGLLNGMQSLRQLLPLGSDQAMTIPYVKIADYPRFAWRGLHLDVSRHFFGVDEVKRFIDLMSMYKFNVFHWHLTDDQGWRIEIKKHPELTEKGAWRQRVGFTENQEKGLNEDNGKPYGGFYTQDEIRDVIEYARLRGITIIPEVDMPGHSVAALFARPDLYCPNAEKAPVRMTGGVSNGVFCAGKEETFALIEDVLDEIIELFPSELIHVGGDEAPKDNWKKCPLCQARIKKEGLKNEQELQSYFMKRLEAYINSKGRRLIGWDEIMEGGLSKSATVMSWRGVVPGIEAAQAGNDVVMTPGSFVYISQPQSVNDVTKAEGDVLTMRHLYEFNPVPDELDEQAASHILGVQACQWTENTPTPRVLEYKEYPRAIALAEMAWTPQADRNWDSFYSRLLKHLPQLSFYGVEYGAPCYDVTINLVSGEKSGSAMVQFVTEVPDSVYYTLDGSEPTKQSAVYDGKGVAIEKNCTVKACMFRPDGSQGRIASQDILFHKALGCKVDYLIGYSSKHDGGGDYAMTNGMLEKWQGFEKSDADFVIDLGREVEVNKITSHWKYDVMDWVLRPTEVCYKVSADGKKFDEIHKVAFDNKAGVFDKGMLEVAATLDGRKIRYIEVTAKSLKVNPDWHHSAGAACWIFVDEVVVE